MGTNYYLHKSPCKCCGMSKNIRHVGKQSGGWQFHFQGYRYENPILSFDDWMNEMTSDDVLKDEYERDIPYEEFWMMVATSLNDMSPYNINMYEPQTDKEKDYILREYAKGPRYFDSKEYCLRHQWKDENGWTFTGEDFS